MCRAIVTRLGRFFREWVGFALFFVCFRRTTWMRACACDMVIAVATANRTALSCRFFSFAVAAAFGQA